MTVTRPPSISMRIWTALFQQVKFLICPRDGFVASLPVIFKTKTGRGDSMNIQESAEFQTSKFYCKTDFDMKKIAEEEANYKNYQIPKFYTFPSKDPRNVFCTRTS